MRTPLPVVRLATCLVRCLVPALALNAQQSGVSTEELHKRLKNPFSQTISLSYTSEFDFGSGSGKTSYLGTFQPVIPFTAGGVSFINRPAFSFARVPLEGANGALGGIGDLGYQLFLTPARARTIRWGLGPAFVFPTATREAFGNGKWTVGPTAAIVVQPGKLSLAVAATNLWSYAGDKRRPPTDQLSLEYSVDYSLGRGWSLSTDPVMTDDWRGAAGESWFVPVGGGLTKTYSDRVPLQISVLAYRNVVRPSFASSWSLQIVLTPVLAIK
jgi:hypothetical protein